MEKKIYYLSSCSTCKRIMEYWNAKNFILQDIRIQNIDAPSLDHLKSIIGSYEALFSRKALKYRSMGLHLKQLTEKDYRKLILQEYTFLKRPVLVSGNNVFVGNTKAVVEAAKLVIHN